MENGSKGEKILEERGGGEVIRWAEGEEDKRKEKGVQGKKQLGKNRETPGAWRKTEGSSEVGKGELFLENATRYGKTNQN